MVMVGGVRAFKGPELVPAFSFLGELSFPYSSAVCMVWNLGFYCFNCSVVIDTLHIPGPVFRLHVGAHHVITQTIMNPFYPGMSILACCVRLLSLNMEGQHDYWKQLTFHFCWHLIPMGASQGNSMMICNEQRHPLI